MKISELTTLVARPKAGFRFSTSSWHVILAIAPLLLAPLATAASAQQCPVTREAATYPDPPLTYPLISNRYAVQYKLDHGDWTDAQVHISYYGGTMASPYLTYSHYPPDTSMSFASIPARPSTAVTFRVTKLWGSNFPEISHMSIRPRAKGIQVESVSGRTVQLSTMTGSDFAGDQFILWWDGGTHEGGGIQGLAFFLDPPYDKPTGRNVKTVTVPADLTGDLSSFDTLDFEGTVAIGSTGAKAFIVPAHITNIFLAHGAWLQGKLRLEQSGSGQERRLYGPGVLDISRFGYMWRQCRNSNEHTDDGYQSVSMIPLAAGGTGRTLPHDRFVLDGIVVLDSQYYATDLMANAVINNVKIIGWNGNSDGLALGLNTRASNVFVRTGDDSLKMWGSSVTVTNATVWQNWNGAVVNLGWFNNSPGDDGLIDGLYVVKTDWRTPVDVSWNVKTNGASNSVPNVTALNSSNNAVIASLMVPGTKFGASHPSLYRNIYVEDPPRVLFSLKILPVICSSIRMKTCPEVDASQPSILNLNIENVFTPASIVKNSIGFQNLPGGSTLKGSMNIGLTNVVVTSRQGAATPLTNANATILGNVVTNGDHVNVEYKAERRQ
jgi:hypothetical protein